MKILLIAEHDHQTIKNATYHALTAVRELPTAEIDVLVAGFSCDAAAKIAATLPQVNSVLQADAKEYQYFLAENMASLIAALAPEYAYICAGSSTFSKNILPRVAALLDVAMVSDITKIVSADTFVRPIYAGNALATVCTKDKIKIITVRTTAFAASMPESNHSAPIKKVELVFAKNLSVFKSHELTQSSRPDLTSAKIIVSGGRGLKSAENFKMVEQLADQLNAAIGASRAAVDAGFAPNDYQVGQTGKVVAPELYIAIGISGAIQHVAGMKDSKIIVAVNNDPEAAIFEIADYGLVGDLFTILPELCGELKKHAS